MLRLSVIIPVYNEEKSIKETILSINNYLANKYAYEIIVVNDGSRDQTSDILREIKNHLPSLKIIEYKRNKGKGFAVKQGILVGKGDFLLFCDADHSTSIDQIEKFWPYFKDNYDLVIASIGVKGAEVINREKFYKRIFRKLGNLWIQFWLLPGIRDTQRGFKMFTAKAAQEIFKRQTIKRWGFDFEILTIAKKLGYKIKEVPVRWQNNPISRVKIRDYFFTLFEVIKVWFNLLKGKYN